MTEVQLIIRFPEHLAEIVHKALQKSKDNLDIKLNPEESTNKTSTHMSEPNKASVKFGEQTFPALIARLPCNIETHKTFDHVHYYKAGDIAEMVQVFDTEEEREFAYYEMCQVEGYRRTYMSGITPPTAQIIKRRFLKTHSVKQKPREMVSQVEAEIQKYASGVEVIEQFEEVVDFEEYMADADNPDGRVYTFDSASLTADTIEFQNHPEMLIRSSDKEMLAMLEEKEKRRMAKSSTNSEPKAEDEKDGKGGGDIVQDDDADEEEEEVEEDGNAMDIANNGSGSGNNSESDSDSDDDDFLNDIQDA